MKTISSLLLMFIFSGTIILAQSLPASRSYSDILKERQERERKWLEEMNNVSQDFPKNVVVLDYYPSCLKGIHYYYPDGTYVFQYLHGTPTEIGKWSRNGNKISISIHTEVGERNFGEPMPIEGYSFRDDCPEEIYSIFFKYEKYVSSESGYVLGDYFHTDRFIDTTMKACDFDYKRLFVDGDYKMASCKALTSEDIDHFENAELRLMRNEIFARYGYIFNDIKLQAYFSKKDWYKPRGKDVNKYLTQLEKDNIKLIQELENK
jgi:hypothetical protein